MKRPTGSHEDHATLSWTSAHVFRHDDLDTLLTDAVVPLVNRLSKQQLIRGFFYLRYWEGGPHLRVRVQAIPEHSDRVRSELADELSAYLRANPSRDLVTQTSYKDWAAHFAGLEALEGYEPYLRSPDTISFEKYVPECASFGRGLSLATVERHFCDSARIALQTVPLPLPQRLSTAMVMTLATHVSLPPANTSRKLAAEDEAAWRASRDDLVGMARRLHTAEPESGPDLPVLDWLGSMRELRNDLTALQTRDLFEVSRERPVAHALHRCLHLHLNRMGIKPEEERRLRGLSRRAVSAVIGS
ncbi:lantibiotic dehydratase C-terminal domain-containing protein [Streptomyces sp. NPDC088354]|uniref:lantibiotic dehydratase C-terminal domain-containing protein n=1 Tax=Streptomyces sp. NPDC088354 TaxID=3365856 RepID=UPI00380F644A